MEAIEIDLNDYTLAGGGFNGESYNSKLDPSIMLKLYFPGKITQPLDEMTLARKVYNLGIPTPEPGEYVVTGHGRYGIRFHRILGKKSIARACGDNPQLVEKYAFEFARMCRLLHGTKVNPAEFEDIKEIHQAAGAKPFLYHSGERQTVQIHQRCTRHLHRHPRRPSVRQCHLQGRPLLLHRSRRFLPRL